MTKYIDPSTYDPSNPEHRQAVKEVYMDLERQRATLLLYFTLNGTEMRDIIKTCLWTAAHCYGATVAEAEADTDVAPEIRDEGLKQFAMFWKVAQELLVMGERAGKDFVEKLIKLKAEAEAKKQEDEAKSSIKH